MSQSIHDDDFAAQCAAAITETVIEQYRPSNGTDGDCYMGHWCEQCQRDRPEEEEYCPILGNTFYFSLDDPEYPKEWCLDQFGIAQCTAFVPEGYPLPPQPCAFTGDLFAEAAT